MNRLCVTVLCVGTVLLSASAIHAQSSWQHLVQAGREAWDLWCDLMTKPGGGDAEIRAKYATFQRSIDGLRQAGLSLLADDLENFLRDPLCRNEVARCEQQAFELLNLKRTYQNRPNFLKSSDKAIAAKIRKRDYPSHVKKARMAFINDMLRLFDLHFADGYFTCVSVNGSPDQRRIVKGEPFNEYLNYIWAYLQDGIRPDGYSWSAFDLAIPSHLLSWERKDMQKKIVKELREILVIAWMGDAMDLWQPRCVPRRG